MKVCVYLRMARAEEPDEKKISPEMQRQFDKIKKFIETQNHTISVDEGNIDFKSRFGIYKRG